METSKLMSPEQFRLITEKLLPPVKARLGRAVRRAKYARRIDVSIAVGRAMRWVNSADRRCVGRENELPPGHIAEKLELASRFAKKGRRR